MSIKDVAKAAGVATSTVSRVINGGDNSAASPETRERIWAAARSLGYVPDQSARSLRRAKPVISGAVQRFDCIFARVVGASVDDFFERLMHEIRAEAMSCGVHLGSIFTLDDLISGAMLPVGTKAAVVLGRINEEQLALLRKHYQHIVCVSLQDRDLPIDQVISRGYDAVRTSIEYLISMGHSRICYIGEIEDEQRYEAYLGIMNRLGISDPEALVVDAAFSPASGYDAAQELLSRRKPFTAILCANDMLVLGVLKALNEAHLRVPDNISIIGINDKEDVRYLDPMLTALNIPIEEMAHHATKLIIDRMNGGHRIPVKMVLPNRLILRESCAPVRRK